MARYVLIAMNGPTAGPGDEEVYNQWYSSVHIPDLLATPGIVSAKRYKVVQGDMARPYVALYEIETDDLASVFAHMQEHNSPFHPTFDRERSAHIVAVALGDA